MKRLEFFEKVFLFSIYPVWGQDLQLQQKVSASATAQLIGPEALESYYIPVLSTCLHRNK